MCWKKVCVFTIFVCFIVLKDDYTLCGYHVSMQFKWTFTVFKKNALKGYFLIGDVFLFGEDHVVLTQSAWSFLNSEPGGGSGAGLSQERPSAWDTCREAQSARHDFQLLEKVALVSLGLFKRSEFRWLFWFWSYWLYRL